MTSFLNPTYKVLDENGMDVIGQYVTLEQAKEIVLENAGYSYEDYSDVIED